MKEENNKGKEIIYETRGEQTSKHLRLETDRDGDAKVLKASLRYRKPEIIKGAQLRTDHKDRGEKGDKSRADD